MLLYYAKACAAHMLVSSVMEEDNFCALKTKWCIRKESRFPTMSEEEMAVISSVFVPSNIAENT